MVRIIFLIFLFIYPFKLYGNGLSDQEKVYFKLIDLNNDNFISNHEIMQTINTIFGLIDKNNDKKISEKELQELKYIIDLLS